jgi:hypothetical protein
VFSSGNSSAVRVDAHRDTCAATTTITADVASNPAHGTQSPNPTPSRSDEDAETGNPIHKSRQLVISQRTRRVALGALARLRKLVRDGDHQLASRLGVSFMVWSLVDNLALTRICSDHGELGALLSYDARGLHFCLSLALLTGVGARWPALPLRDPLLLNHVKLVDQWSGSSCPW